MCADVICLVLKLFILCTLFINLVLTSYLSCGHKLVSCDHKLVSCAHTLFILCEQVNYLVPPS